MMPQELQSALASYRQDRSAAKWTTLSQLPVGDVTVLDALQALEPDFPEPLPLPVDGVVTDDAQFFQWGKLPDPDRVLQAIVSVLNQEHH